jgi:hypothetical protein
MTPKLALNLRAAVDDDDGRGPYHVMVRIERDAYTEIASMLKLEIQSPAQVVVGDVSFEQLRTLSEHDGVHAISLSSPLHALG